MQMREALPELVAAFEGLFDKPAERDPQCWGKNAIAKALMELEYRESEAFLRGARHIQMEPIWGGRAATASTLSDACRLGLVACSGVTLVVILPALPDGLIDQDEKVRGDAAQAARPFAG